MLFDAVVYYEVERNPAVRKMLESQETQGMNMGSEE